jgi:chaperonin GroES
MRKITPMNDCVLVRRETAKEQTPGGLYIPDNAREKMHFGTVLEVGPGKVLDSGKLREPRLQKAQQVIFGKYAGQEFELDGEKGLLLLREDEILGVLSQEQSG